MDLIANTIDVVRVGEPITFELLTMWPLAGEDEGPRAQDRPGIAVAARARPRSIGSGTPRSPSLAA